MKRKIITSILVIALMVFAGCYSLTTYQNADTVPAKQVRAGIGISYLNVTDTSDSDTDSDNNFIGSIPMTEMLFRIGLSDSMDIGFKLYGINLSFDWKWRLTSRESPFRIATDFGGIYQNLFGVQGFSGFGNLIFDFRFSDSISLYFGPKAQYSTYVVIGESTTNVDFAQIYYGGFIGFQFDLGKVTLTPEVDVYKLAFRYKDETADIDALLFQPGISIGFNF
jgi:hypothetical protein